MDQHKKKISLHTSLDVERRDKAKMRSHLLENYASIPQEHRLSIWKLMLGITNVFQSQNHINKQVSIAHYQYLVHILSDVLHVDTSLMPRADQFNYCLYLLDKGHLPLKKEDMLTNSKPFCLIYNQMREILDDQTDIESYYITVEFYENLKANLPAMKEKFNSILQAHLKESPSKAASIGQVNIDQYLLTGLAGVFNDIKLYHIIWDRCVIGEFDMLVYALIACCTLDKDDCLKYLRNADNSFSEEQASASGSLKQRQDDEAKLLKSIVKYYKQQCTHHVHQLILSYFSTK